LNYNKTAKLFYLPTQIARSSESRKAYNVAQQNKLFSGNEFVKRCVMDGTETVLPQNRTAFENADITKIIAVPRAEEIDSDLLTVKLCCSDGNFHSTLPKPVSSLVEVSLFTVKNIINDLNLEISYKMFWKPFCEEEIIRSKILIVLMVPSVGEF
jgi:hypothetical protein